eukprot:TRINITY_DN5961_c0_g4_i1.p1 TRINITY_DN5961_c0_g4~~TRINITY_DN5961_c0_g4_i1.p1  ORF type:complete len:156 (+),score=25.28 TRINITY_DN5961_c0_g4_i1:34-501(+)
MKTKNNSQQEQPIGFMTSAQYKSFRQSVDEMCEAAECVPDGYKATRRTPLRVRANAQRDVGVKQSMGEVRKMSERALKDPVSENNAPPQNIKVASEDPVELRLISYARKYKAHKENLIREHNLKLQQEVRPPILNGKSVSIARSKEVFDLPNRSG